MSVRQPTVAHQFDDVEQQQLSATLGMWTFLATEILFFGGMFAGYMLYRTWYPSAWSEASRHLDLLWGTINTGVLLSSSLTMALAVDGTRLGMTRRRKGALIATVVLGVAFLGIKGYEYAHKWHESLVPGDHFHWSGAATEAGPAELFFSFYFVMTGFHAFHMVIGIGLLLFLLGRDPRDYPHGRELSLVENVGLYWHFVDIVWIYLFPLLYLIDRSTGGGS